MSQPSIRALYQAAKPELRTFMEANWRLIEQHIQTAIGRAKHAKAVSISMLEEVKNDFIVPVSKLAKVQEKAKELGVRFTTSKPNPQHIYSEMEEKAITNEMRRHDLHRYEVSLSIDTVNWLRQRAQELADENVIIHAIAPPVEDRVIALAKDDHGESQLYNLPFGEPYWSEDNKDVDYRRCDICGKAIARNQIFVITGKRHGTRLVGGECAKNLNLANKLASMLDAFKMFGVAMDALGDEDDGYGHTAKTAEDPGRLLLLSDIIIRKMGYVSKKRAEESYPPVTSTALALEYVLSDRPSDVERTKEIWQEYNRRAAAGDKAILLATALEFAKDFTERAKRNGNFNTANQINVGLKTGSLKSLGALAWVASQLPEWMATRGGGVVGGWLPTLNVVIATDPLQYTVHGHNLSASYGFDDKRLTTHVTVSSTRPVPSKSAGKVETANPHLTFQSEYPEIALDLARQFRNMVVPTGKFIHVVVEVNSPGIIDNLKNGTYDVVADIITKAARRALEEMGEHTTYAATIDTLNAYEKQEPGFIARMDRLDGGKRYAKAVTTGKLAKDALQSLTRTVPGVWTVTQHKVLTPTAFGRPQMYSLKRGDGALINIKSSDVLSKHYADGLSKWRKTDTDLEPGDRVYLTGTFEWPVPYRPGEAPIGRLTRAAFSFVEGPLPDRLLR